MEEISVLTRNLVISTLQEPSYFFSRIVSHIITVCGYRFAAEILGKTLLVEIEGGMLTADETRRRTMGGTYMRLANDLMTEEQRSEVERLTRRSEKLVEEAKAAKAARKAANIAAQEKLRAKKLAANNPPAPEVVRQQPKVQKPKNDKAGKSTSNKRNDVVATRQARFQAPRVEVGPLPDDLPSHIRDRIIQLHGATKVLRDRIFQLEAKPPGQQMGLEMTRKMLASNESQIAALLAEHQRSGEVAS